MTNLQYRTFASEAAYLTRAAPDLPAATGGPATTAPIFHAAFAR